MINDDDLHALSLARATWLAADRRAVEAQEAYLDGAVTREALQEARLDEHAAWADLQAAKAGIRRPWEVRL